MAKRSMPYQLTLAVILVSSQWAIGQQSPDAGSNRTQDPRDSLIVCKYPLVSIDAQVISRTSGTTVSDLTHEEFIISENGDQQILASFHRFRAPLSLVILIDSGRTNREPWSLQDRVSALSMGLVRALDPGDEVSVLSLTESRQMLLDYTSNQELISAALEKAYLQGNPAGEPPARQLRLALERAAQQARIAHNPEARRAIILISDGFQRSRDELLPAKVLTAILGSGSALCLADSEGTEPQFVGETQDLDTLTLDLMVGLTGGSFLDDDWASALERMRAIYRIAYWPDSRRSGELVNIKLELKPDAKRDASDLTLVYPRFAILPHE